MYNIKVGKKYLFSYLCCNSIVCHWNVANFTHNWPNLRPLIATTQKGNVVGIFSKEEIRNMYYTVDYFDTLNLNFDIQSGFFDEEDDQGWNLFTYLYARCHSPLLIRNCSWILTIHNFPKKAPWKQRNGLLKIYKLRVIMARVW